MLTAKTVSEAVIILDLRLLVTLYDIYLSYKLPS